jgi:hypothetical protein
MFHKNLPIKSNEESKQEYFSFIDANNVKQEIIDKIKKGEDKKNIDPKDQSGNYITVEHSYIDFQRLILNNKMSMINC